MKKKMSVCVSIVLFTIRIYGMQSKQNIEESTAKKSPIRRVQQMQTTVNNDTNLDGRRTSPTLRVPKTLNTFVSPKKENMPQGQGHNNM